MSHKNSEMESLSLDKKKSSKNNNKPFQLGSKFLPIDYLSKNYKSGSKYSLKNINSLLVSLEDGKIYNLLEKDSQKRKITCGCVKSSCQAKYCQCFRWGETCSDECNCIGCKNKSPNNIQVAKIEETGCNCLKSGCRKKYCQCFQRGKKCGQHCNCRKCLNKD